MPFNGREVKAHTALAGQGDRYPVEVFGQSRTLVRYKSWLRVGRVHVSLEVWAEGLPGFDNSYGWEE